MIGKPAEVTQIPARCSSFDGSRRRDSVYGLDGSRSERPVLPACSQPWPKVTVVIPTLNEARNLPHVFAKLPAGLHEVIVVDGHSVDDTVATARRLRPDVRIVMQNRSGKVVSEILVEGLLRKDGKVLYPVRNSIPVMLVEEGITLGLVLIGHQNNVSRQAENAELIEHFFSRRFIGFLGFVSYHNELFQLLFHFRGGEDG